MDTTEYRWVDAPASSAGLLDAAGLPDTATEGSEHLILAQLASAIHQSAPHLSAPEIELAVRWLKSWKQQAMAEKARLTSRRDLRRFSEVLEDLRDSPQQQKLGWVAYRETLGARAMTAAAGAIGVVLAGLWALDFSKIWVGAAIVIPLYLLYKSDRMSVAALERAKRQDRVYALRSLYAAESLEELEQAGLFTHVPELEMVKFPDWGRNHAELMPVLERFRDAVYHDPEGLAP